MQGADSDASEEALGDYVVVEREDVLEAIGQFVAAYRATLPEAQHLQPKQLQRALAQTFKVCAPAGGGPAPGPGAASSWSTARAPRCFA